MTVRELKRLIKNLDPDMQVVMITNDDSLVPTCKANSQVITVMDDELGEKEEILLLLPCGCHDEPEIELGDINSQPELN